MLGGSQTGSGGTDASNSADLKISHTDSAPARLFGQDISGITDEPVSSSPQITPTSNVIFPSTTPEDSASTPTPDPAPASDPNPTLTPDLTSANPTSPPTTFESLSTSAPIPQTPASAPTPQTAPSLAPISPTPPPNPTPTPTPSQPSVSYEQQFVQSLRENPATAKSSDTGDIILNNSAKKSKTGLIIAIVVALIVVVALVAVAALSMTSINPISNLTTSPVEKSFNTYANYVLYGTDSSDIFNDEDNTLPYVYVQKLYNGSTDQSYLDDIYQKYQTFYSQVPASGSLHDAATAYQQLLDFLKINPSSEDFSNDTLTAIYLEDGETAAKRAARTALAKIPKDNQYSTEFLEYKTAAFDNLFLYLAELEDLGCIEEGEIISECSLQIIDSDDETTPFRIMYDNDAAAYNLLNTYYDKIGTDCLTIQKAFKGETSA